jgi:hypothetical protein
MSVNEITGDPIRTKPVTDKYAKGWEGIQWGNPDEWIPENIIEQGFKDDGYTREDYLEWLSEQCR